MLLIYHAFINILCCKRIYLQNTYPSRVLGLWNIIISAIFAPRFIWSTGSTQCVDHRLSSLNRWLISCIFSSRSHLLFVYLFYHLLSLWKLFFCISYSSSCINCVFTYVVSSYNFQSLIFHWWFHLILKLWNFRLNWLFYISRLLLIIWHFCFKCMFSYIFVKWNLSNYMFRFVTHNYFLDIGCRTQLTWILVFRSLTGLFIDIYYIIYIQRRWT